MARRRSPFVPQNTAGDFQRIEHDSCQRGVRLEITTKARIGKLPGAIDVAADVAGCVASQGFTPLDITLLHAQRAGNLTGEHRDPFDRMLIAQAQLEDVAIVSDDDVFDAYDVRRYW